MLLRNYCVLHIDSIIKYYICFRSSNNIKISIWLLRSYVWIQAPKIASRILACRFYIHLWEDLMTLTRGWNDITVISELIFRDFTRVFVLIRQVAEVLRGVYIDTVVAYVMKIVRRTVLKNIQSRKEEVSRGHLSQQTWGTTIAPPTSPSSPAVEDNGIFG